MSGRPYRSRGAKGGDSHLVPRFKRCSAGLRHTLQKKSTSETKTPQPEFDLIERRLKAVNVERERQ
jgi:ribosomal protein L35